jgi:hypothetical protein
METASDAVRPCVVEALQSSMVALDCRGRIQSDETLLVCAKKGHRKNDPLDI